jgi:hypothetical protein
VDKTCSWQILNSSYSGARIGKDETIDNLDNAFGRICWKSSRSQKICPALALHDERVIASKGFDSKAENQQSQYHCRGTKPAFIKAQA